MFKRIPTPEEYEIERARKALSLVDGIYSVVPNSNFTFPVENNYYNNKKPTVRIRRPLKGASSISQHGYNNNNNKNKESFQEHIARCQICRAMYERTEAKTGAEKALRLNARLW